MKKIAITTALAALLLASPVRADAPAHWCEAGSVMSKGTASWYGPGFHGHRTANGETFDMHAMTAAHKTLKLGSRVEVENPQTGDVIVVRINDRGPYIGKRMIDLSSRAARELGFHDKGLAKVVMRVCMS